MTLNSVVVALADWLIQRACRRLRSRDRDERYAEWSAEIPAILDDPDVRPALRRAWRALSFAADQRRTTVALRTSREHTVAERFWAVANIVATAGAIVGGMGFAVAAAVGNVSIAVGTIVATVGVVAAIVGLALVVARVTWKLVGIVVGATAGVVVSAPVSCACLTGLFTYYHVAVVRTSVVVANPHNDIVAAVGIGTIAGLVGCVDIGIGVLGCALHARARVRARAHARARLLEGTVVELW
jgi:hypothetical protein